MYIKINRELFINSNEDSTTNCCPGIDFSQMWQRYKVMCRANAAEVTQNPEWDSLENIESALDGESNKFNELMQFCESSGENQSGFVKVMSHHQLLDLLLPNRDLLCSTTPTWWREFSLMTLDVDYVTAATVTRSVIEDLTDLDKVSLGNSQKARERALEVRDSLWKNLPLLRHYGVERKVKNKIYLSPAVYKSLVALIVSIGQIIKVLADTAVDVSINIPKFEVLGGNLCAGMQQIVEAYFELQEAKKLLESDDFAFINTVLNDCWTKFEAIIKALENENIMSQKKYELELLSSIGDCFIECGCVHYFLMMPGPVDPVLRHRLNKSCNLEEIKTRKGYLAAREKLSVVLTGSVDSEIMQHPRIELIRNRICEEEKIVEELDTKLKDRNDWKSYDKLQKVCNEFVTSKLDMLQNERKQILKLVYNEDDLRENRTDLLQAFDGTLRQLRQEFNKFDDVTRPMVDSLQQMKFGFEMLFSSAQMMVSNQECSSSRTSEKMIDYLVKEGLDCYDTDVKSLMDQVELLLTDSKTYRENKKEDQPAYCLMNDEKLLKVFLSRCKLNAVEYGVVNVDQMMQLVKIIGDKWVEKCEYEQRKMAEEGSLYRYKKKEHEDLTEEELDEIEMKNLFPSSYNSNEEETEEIDENLANLEHEKDEAYLSDEFFSFSVATFAEIMTSTSLENNESAAITNAMTSYDIIKDQVILNSAKLWSGSVDSDLIGMNLLYCERMQQSLTVTSQEQCDDSQIDVEKGGTVSEARLCVPVLEGLMLHVDQLRQQYEYKTDIQEILKFLLTKVKMVWDFPINSPLMQFVLGLESILKSVQVWKTNDHRQLGLDVHLDKVRALVLKWRKIELKNWSTLLDKVEDKEKQIASKWFFMLLETVQKYNDDQVDDDGKLEDRLSEFILDSTVIQFEGKLQMIKVACTMLSFDCNRSVQTQKIINIMENTFAYYNQFQQMCNDRIQVLRRDVEKELKDFIKMKMYNSVSDKNDHFILADTHTKRKKLLKLVKKYKTALKEKVAQKVFTNTQQATCLASEQSSDEAHLSETAKFLQSWQSQTNKSPIDFSHTDSDETEDDKICRKMRKFSNKWAKHFDEKFAKQMELNEDFACEIISNLKELSKLQPPLPPSNCEEDEEKEAERKKRLSEAKQIQKQKRKGLADLFKVLADGGLSYRQGLIGKDCNTADLINKFMEVSPIKLDVSEDDKLTDRTRFVTENIEPLNTYFYKTLTRGRILLTHMPDASNELQVRDKHQIAGYTNQLLKIKLDQRQQLAKIAGMTSYTARLKTSCNKVAASLKTTSEVGKEISLINQEVCINNIVEARKVVFHFLHSLDLFKPLVKLNPQNCDKLSQCEMNLTALQKRAHQLLKIFTQVFDFNLENSACLDFLNIQLKKGRIIPNETFQEICTKFKEFTEFARITVNEIAMNLPMHEDSPLLKDILKELTRLEKHNFDSFYPNSIDTLTETDETNCKLLMTELKEKIQLVVQNMYKSLPEKQDKIVEEEQTDEVSFKFSEELKMEIKSLKMDEVSNLFDKVMSSINALSENSKYSNDIVETCDTLNWVLENYCDVIATVNTHVTAAHRSTCKLFSVLCIVFNEVMTKGFCPPQEFEEELKEGDKGEFKGAEENCGMGSGEGQKDVSDQIENEEQVEDAPGEEQDDQQDEVPDEEEGIEMTEDFEGKMHDAGGEDQEEEENEEEQDEEDPDEQMGDLEGEDEADKLDERMWGDEEDEDEEQQNKGEEEKGKGVDQEEGELGAKDDELDEGDNEEEKKEKKDEEKVDNDENEMVDESEYNENEKDENYDNENAKEEENEEFDLPENMNVSGDEEEENEEEQQEDFDIDEEEKPKDTEGNVEDENEEDKNEDENKESDEKEDDVSDEKDNSDDVSDCEENGDDVKNLEIEQNENEKEEDDEEKDSAGNEEDQKVKSNADQQQDENLEEDDELDTIKKDENLQNAQQDDNLMDVDENNSSSAPQQNELDGEKEEQVGHQMAPDQTNNASDDKSMTSQRMEEQQNGEESRHEEKKKKTDNKRSLADQQVC